MDLIHSQRWTGAIAEAPELIKGFISRRRSAMDLDRNYYWF